MHISTMDPKTGNHTQMKIRFKTSFDSVQEPTKAMKPIYNATRSLLKENPFGAVDELAIFLPSEGVNLPLEYLMQDCSMAYINGSLIERLRNLAKSNACEVKEFKQWFKVIESTSVVEVCVDEYLDIYNHSVTLCGNRTNDYIGMKEEGFLSFALTICSVVSLIVTICTYAGFKKLRQSASGWQVVSICLSLMLAQSSYQFGAYAHEVRLLCVSLSVATHYFYLLYFVLASAFSISMCRRFSSLKTAVENIQAFQEPPARLSRLSRALVFLLPAPVIITSALLDFLNESPLRVGYGKENSCWITEPLAKISLFIAPVGLSVLINCIVVAIVVRRLFSMRREVSPQINTSWNLLSVASRLFVLTGLSWVIGFLAVVVDHEVVWILFITFNASQGVLIAIAMLSRRDVIAKYTCNH